MFCMKCGAQLEENEKFCHVCGRAAGGETAKEETLHGNISRKSGQTFRTERIKLSENEAVVKQYRCTTLRWPLVWRKCDGYLTVTNQRIVFEGSGIASRFTQETWIENVSGVHSFYGNNVELLHLLFGFFALFTGLSLLQAIPVVSFVLIAVGGFLLYSFVVLLKCFRLTIFARNFVGSGISLGRTPASLIGNAALRLSFALPTADTEQMLDELGALIKDIQIMGESASEKGK